MFLDDFGRGINSSYIDKRVIIFSITLLIILAWEQLYSKIDIRVKVRTTGNLQYLLRL